MSKNFGQLENDFIQQLDNDPVLKDLKEQLEAIKSQMTVVLANTVNHIINSAPQELKDHPSCSAALVIKSLVNGLSNDLCVKTMDIVDPDWIAKLPQTFEEVLSALKQQNLSEEPRDKTTRVIH